MSEVILFACVHNAGRSQMAAAWFNTLADPSKATAISAGTQPGVSVHPVVAAAMQEKGIDLSKAAPRLLTCADDLGRVAEIAKGNHANRSTTGLDDGDGTDPKGEDQVTHGVVSLLGTGKRNLGIHDFIDCPCHGLTRIACAGPARLAVRAEAMAGGAAGGHTSQDDSFDLSLAERRVGALADL